MASSCTPHRKNRLPSSKSTTTTERTCIEKEEKLWASPYYVLDFEDVKMVTESEELHRLGHSQSKLGGQDGEEAYHAFLCKSAGDTLVLRQYESCCVSSK
jgi:hypothetical protein